MSEYCPVCGGSLELSKGELVCSSCGTVAETGLPGYYLPVDDDTRARVKRHSGPPLTPGVSHTGDYITRSPRSRMLRTKDDEVERAIAQLCPIKRYQDQALALYNKVKDDLKGWGAPLIAAVMLNLACNIDNVEPKDTMYHISEIRKQKDGIKLLRQAFVLLRAKGVNILPPTTDALIKRYAYEYYSKLRDDPNNVLMFNAHDLESMAESILASLAQDQTGIPKSRAASILYVTAESYFGVTDAHLDALEGICSVKAATLRDRAKQLVAPERHNNLYIFPWYVRYIKCPQCRKRTVLDGLTPCRCGAFLTSNQRPPYI